MARETVSMASAGPPMQHEGQHEGHRPGGLEAYDKYAEEPHARPSQGRAPEGGRHEQGGHIGPSLALPVNEHGEGPHESLSKIFKRCGTLLACPCGACSWHLAG